MWDCIECGVKKIAHSLTHCPVCKEERQVPKTTTGGGTNAWEPDQEPEEQAEDSTAPAEDKEMEDQGTGDDGLKVDSDPQDDVPAKLSDGGVVTEVPSEEEVEPDPKGSETSEDKASRLAREAKKAFDDGDHEAALVLIDEAAEVYPSRSEHWDKLKLQIESAADKKDSEKTEESW